MDENGNFKMVSDGSIHPYQGDYKDFVNDAKTKLSRFLQDEMKSNRLQFQADSSTFCGMFVWSYVCLRRTTIEYIP